MHYMAVALQTVWQTEFSSHLGEVHFIKVITTVAASIKFTVVLPLAPGGPCISTEVWITGENESWEFHNISYYISKQSLKTNV